MNESQYEEYETDELFCKTAEGTLVQTESEADDGDDDVDFLHAVDTLVSLENETQIELPPKKKQKKEEKKSIGERELIHRIMGCRHCKCKFGYDEDINIHRRIDEIFDKMRQTVK